MSVIFGKFVAVKYVIGTNTLKTNDIMKKLFLCGSALLMVLAMTSCKSSESAYKKAWEKAQAAQTSNQVVQQQTTPSTTTPTTPAQTTTVTTPANSGQDYGNVSVRAEEVTLVSGSGLRAFSVVVGSFSLQSNAQALQATLANKGYAAQVVSAVVNGSNFYRVVATTHDTKAQAAQSRASLLGNYPDAWLLYKK